MNVVCFVMFFGDWVLICGHLCIFVLFSSVLKEMVRDLEQIKENGESQLVAKKDKCSTHANANANGQHCKCSVIEVLRFPLI